MEVQKSHFSVDAQEIVVSFNCPERDLRKYFHLAVSAEVSSEVSWRYLAQSCHPVRDTGSQYNVGTTPEGVIAQALLSLFFGGVF